MPRLRDYYHEEVVPQLTERFQYRSAMQVPRLVKMTLNMGVGEAIGDKKVLDNALADLERIAGQKAIVTRARKSATISFAASRRMFSQWIAPVPSRFVDELPREQLDIVTELGLPRDPVAAAGDDFAGEEVTETVGRGPGYARLRRARRSGPGTLIEGRARRVDEQASSVGIGVRVFHQKFGYGKVLAADAGKLEIVFEKAGTKKVMESFVEPA